MAAIPSSATGVDSPRFDTPRNRDLALLGGPVLDVPPRTAYLLAVAASGGVVLIVVESHIGNRPATVEIDKVIHFAGYAVLAAVFVLGLRPRWYIPALVGLVGLSYVIELVQPLNMRSRDIGDALANTLGVALGAAVGLGARLVYGYLRTELNEARVRRSLVRVKPGTTIVRAGDVTDRFFVVKRGLVSLYQEQDGHLREVAQSGPSEMFGLLEEILRVPQQTTAVVRADAEIYQLDYDELIEAVGGRDQPVGVVLQRLAVDLRDAWDTVARLQHGDSAASPPTAHSSG